MPIHQLPNGKFQWGHIPAGGTTKKHAEEIAAAAHANGYMGEHKEMSAKKTSAMLRAHDKKHA